MNRETLECERELRKSAEEAEDRDRPHEFSTRLLATTELPLMLEEVLNATIALQCADFGNVQLYNPRIQRLEIVAQRGFGQDFLDHFSSADESGAACFRALKRAERVIIEDVLTDPDFAPHRAIATSAGFRAVQSTPLFSRNGESLGIVSTHFRQPHRPSERELRLTDLYARQAAELIERAQAEEALRESEEKYRTLFDSIDEGFCTIEVLFDGNDKPIDYRFLEVNPSFEKQTGIQNAQGRRMREIAPQHEEHWFEIYGRIALTGEPVRFENQAAHLHRWYDAYAFRVGEPGDRKVAILFKDITERKQAEEELRRSEGFLAQGERIGHIGSWGWHVATGLVYWSKEHFRIFDYEPETTKPSNSLFVERIHPDDRFSFEEILNRAVRDKSDFEYDYRIVLPDRSIKFLRSVGQALVNPSGELEFIGTVMDITDLKRAEERRAAMAHERELFAQQRATDLGKANEALRGCLDALASVPELDDFLGQVMAAITRQLGAVSSTLRVRNFEQNTMPLELVFQDGRVNRTLRWTAWA